MRVKPFVAPSLLFKVFNTTAGHVCPVVAGIADKPKPTAAEGIP